MRALLSFLPVTFGTMHCFLALAFAAVVVALVPPVAVVPPPAAGAAGVTGAGVPSVVNARSSPGSVPAALETTMRAW